MVAVRDDAPARPGARGRRPILIALAAVAAIVTVLAVVDRSSSDDDPGTAGADRTTTTDEDENADDAGSTGTSGRTNTPTTPPDRPFVSTISLPDGVRLMGWLSSGWGEILDPATGTISSTRIASGSEFVSVVPRLGGAIVVNPSTSSARWFPELPAEAEVGPLRDSVNEAHPSDIASRVWLVRGMESTVLTELELSTGEVVDELELPANVHPAGAVEGGVVLVAPGGLYRYRRGEDRFDHIASGEFVASSGSKVAFRRCDERLVCPIFVHDLNDGSEHVLGTSSEAGGYLMNSSMSPDGRWLAVVIVEPAGGSRIVVYDLATGDSLPVRTGPARTAPFLQPSWTPDGHWLLYPDFPGVRAFNPSENTAATLDSDGAPYQGVVVLSTVGSTAG